MFPSAWDKVPLRLLLSKPIQNGYSPVCDEKPNGRWILGLGALKENGLDISQKKPAPKDDLKVNQYLLSKGDFLISRSNTIDKVGRSALFKGEIENCAYSDLMMRFRVLEEKVSPDYLAEYLRSEYVLAYLRNSAAGTSGSMKKINKAILEKLIVLLPPIAEQKKIAEILTAWDEAIGLLERTIEAKQIQRQAFIEKLCATGGGKVFEFGRFAELGKQKFSPSEGDDRVCVELEHISQNTGEIIGKTSSAKQNSTKNVFNSGDVLFGKLRPYLRKYANPSFNGVCSSEIWVLKAKPSLCNNRYLFYIVQSNQFIAVSNKTSGSKMPRADWELVSEQPFPLPSLEHQKKIAKVLDSLTEEIRLLQCLKTQWQLQKHGLMQKLLTGEWRVSIQEAA